MKYATYAMPFIVLPLLAGCVHDAQYGEIERSSTGLFLEKLTVTREGHYENDNFARCVTLHAKKTKIMLSGASYSVYSPRTGTHYYGDKVYGSTGDKSYQRVTDNGKKVITFGNARWQFAYNERYMTYRLVAENVGDKRYYVFDSMESGGIDSGNTVNNGAIWPLAARGPEGKAGLQVLVDIVDTIEKCQKNLDAKGK